MPNSVTIRRATLVAFSMSLRRAGGGVAEDELLGRVAAEHAGDLVLELALALQVAVLGGQAHRVAEGHAAADDADLGDRVGLGQDALDDGVTALVVGDDRLLGVADDAALALRAGDDALERLAELGDGDDLLVAPRGEDGGLVDQVGQVRAAEAGRLAGDRLQVDLLVERLALDVDLEDLEAALHVRAVEDDLAVEAARAQQRRVEHVGAVGGGDDDHVGVRVEAVHLDQDLVEGLLALVVRAAQAGAALAADRVDLVDEDDARAVALGLVEQVAHAAGADADEHLDELGAGDAEEGHAGLAGDGAREQRLAGAWRADEQHAARDARAELVELLRVLQELDDFLELCLGLVDAGHVVERDDGLVAQEHARAALAEAERLVVGALRLAEHEEQQRADEQDRQERRDAGCSATGRRPADAAEDRRRGRALGGDAAQAAMSASTLVASSLGNDASS